MGPHPLKLLLVLTLSVLQTLATAHADEKIELETITIRGNKELPKILFVVPWQENKLKANEQQKLVLHSLFGDLFDPINPSDFENSMLPETN